MSGFGDRAGRFAIEHKHGSVASIMGAEPDSTEAPAVWVCEPDEPTMVFGSRQREIYGQLADGFGPRTRTYIRGSGGGAVWLEPGAQVWFEVFLPTSDPLFIHGLEQSFLWLGECWALAINQGSALSAPATVHRGGFESNELAELVCFGGVGPGEVFVGNKKVVGISQRRTRNFARFQATCLLRWDPGDYSLISDDLALSDVATGLDVNASQLAEAVLQQLANR